MPIFRFPMHAPRHPLARLALGIAGLALLGFFTLFGLTVAGLGLAGFALHRLYARLSGRSPGKRQPIDPRIIEGEFSVVEKSRLPPR